MRANVYITVLLLVMLSHSIYGQVDEPKTPWIELRGYVKNLQSTYFVEKIDSNSSANLFHNRLNLSLNISTKITGRIEIRNRIFYGEQIKQVPQFGSFIDQDKGLVKLSHLWANENSFVVHSLIDRMLLHYSADKWDIKIGRQRINWGINNMWNANDIFNAYDFLDFDYEERPGSDAIRIQRYFEDNSVIELAYKPGKNSDDHIGALLFKFNKWQYDFQLFSGVYRFDYVIGGGWAGHIKDTGFKGEFSYFHPRRSTSYSDKAFSFSLMADRTFKNNWYVSIATLYNSKPSDNLSLFGSIYGTELSVKLLFPFRYNIYTTVKQSISPIISYSVSFIYSPEKHTLITIPTFAWSAAENFGIDFTVQSLFSKQPSKYKNQGTGVYIRGRWDF